jgi:hypothetical protein
MKWGPQRFADSFAVLTVILFLAFIGWLVVRGLDPASMIVGTLTSILLLIYQHFYRKAGPTPPADPPSVPHG